MSLACTLEEKTGIAHKFLLPKQLKEHGLKLGDMKLSDSILEMIAENYTRESGVRALEKRIASLARYRAKQIVGEEAFEAVVAMLKKQAEATMPPELKEAIEKKKKEKETLEAETEKDPTKQ